MVKTIRFLIRDYPAIVGFKPPVQKTFQVERHPFTTLIVTVNGTEDTGAVADPYTGTVTLSTAPAQNAVIDVRYAPVWFTDAEIAKAQVVEQTSEILLEQEPGKYVLPAMRIPLVYSLTIDGADQTHVYSEDTMQFTLPEGCEPFYKGTTCNAYATAAYLYTVMASDPDRIRATYAMKSATEITAIQTSFREQSDRLFKLGGMSFD